ncbi:DUF4160 domain-containing protein [Dyadobacter frigoris]|uniref:DUF4160 domain-containing protein n=1 Tax=Dyadobacter frigoris TaxID=2576211 RepID=A0A4U6CXH1_9BACT|nr:DUF4160 domain-containing protein [Dyadobacter frigoris]TKT88525.1 DUF4160 domain-containing protein [Dyadobacter frigoris]GLU54572.1 hypothetical protein Dfri01_40330 [Dyadobacter frigoris]
MPELLRLFGLRFFFYSNDHRPPHVHVRSNDGEARFSINPVNCLENNGLKKQDLYLAEAIVETNKDEFLRKWSEFFKS